MPDPVARASGRCLSPTLNGGIDHGILRDSLQEGSDRLGRCRLNARHTLQACFGIAFAILLDLYFLRNGFTQPSAPVELSRSVLFWIAIAALIGAVKIHPPAVIAKILARLAYIGLVSYPLYLVHQDVGLMFFNWIGVPYSDTLYPRLLRLFLAPTVFIAIASIIHTFVERPLIAPLTGLLSGKRRRAGSAASFPSPAQ